ncbi:3-oxoacyl-[acyl-carrier-protein] synthase, KASIII [Enhygromyxa salina]|uniref:3-oxoacyl-[acyl-carrier-protein] synthase, KASIII n=2 Tax=Enhygromyxa salina TaxID=215803 RepID=A0A0C2CT19_9BACT|nr:3-oxoacyl-[acyl-carrier-protein] synthase, KASIII [Enhygromyxa salina]
MNGMSARSINNPGTIASVGVAFPEDVRTNDWWEHHHPQLVAQHREALLAKVWADHTWPPTGASTYDQCIAPYLEDPFRGTVERRWMGPDDSAQSMELAAAKAAMDAGGFAGADIDLVLVNALRTDSHVIGDGAYLMQKLGMRTPAINFESACSSAVVGFHLASDLIRAGRYRRIMVIACSTYTRDVDPDNSFSWFLGDGAAAVVVEAAPDPEHGLLGAHTIPTLETCGIFYHELALVDGAPRLMIRASRRAGKAIRDNSEAYLRTCVDGALSEAGVRLDDIKFLVVNTPTAWYAQFCAKVLGFEMSQIVDNYPRFANCGPALWANNLHTAVSEGRVAPGDLVLGYSIGSVSTASAVVFRAGEIAVGGR